METHFKIYNAVLTGLTLLHAVPLLKVPSNRTATIACIKANPQTSTGEPAVPV